MINPTHKLPISRQTKLLGLSRSTAYSRPKPVSDSDLALMAAMDRMHLDCPFAGARGLRNILRRQGFPVVGWRHIATLMRKMGIEGSTESPTLPSVIRGTKSRDHDKNIPTIQKPCRIPYVELFINNWIRSIYRRGRSGPKSQRHSLPIPARANVTRALLTGGADQSFDQGGYEKNLRRPTSENSHKIGGEVLKTGRNHSGKTPFYIDKSMI
jgi:hypothetical protein